MAVIVLNGTTDLDYKTNFTFAESTFKEFTKSSGGSDFKTGAILGKYLLPVPFEGDIGSTRIILAQTDKSVRFGFTSLQNRGLAGKIIAGFEFDASTNKLHAIENDVSKLELSQTPAVGNELRVQAIYDSGNYKFLYYWREDDESSEELLSVTSGYSSANVQSFFPLQVRAEAYEEGTIIRNLQIESDVDFAEVNAGMSVNLTRFHLPLKMEMGNIKGGSNVPNHTIFYKGETLNNAANGLAVFKAMKDWTTIKGLKLSVLPENTINSTRDFNIRKNGVNIFESNIVLPANQQKVDLTNLDISCNEDDVFILDYKSLGKQLKSPLFLELAIE